MPVESRDDLVKRLRRRTQQCGVKDGAPTFELVPICLEAATRIESDAKRIAELEAERDDIRLHFDQAMKEFDVRNEEVASLQRALAEERERCAAIADVFADQCDATAIASPVIEQVAALRAKEQAATTIATAIRSGKTDGKE